MTTGLPADVSPDAYSEAILRHGWRLALAIL
jgi:hypothetical protein